MSIKDPSPAVVDAIESAIAWFEQSQLKGIRWIEKRDASQPGGIDRVVVKDPEAGPIWARFYDIGSNRPVFVGRDGVVKYSVAEIEHERRVGYAWYVEEPLRLLKDEYPKWRDRMNKMTQD
jgi:PelA/Pel-15E family pectate lyase